MPGETVSKDMLFFSLRKKEGCWKGNLDRMLFPIYQEQCYEVAHYVPAYLRRSKAGFRGVFDLFDSAFLVWTDSKRSSELKKFGSCVLFI